MLVADIRPGTTEAYALADWIAARRRDILDALASLNCEPRASDVYRGQLAELDELERALTL